MRATTGRRDPLLCPERAALVVLDMQAFFLDPLAPAFSPSAPAIVPLIASLVDSFLRANRPVIFTRHLDRPDRPGSMSRWWRRPIVAKDPASRLIEPFCHPGGKVIGKRQYDAFHGTPLASLLRQHGTGQVVITGVMTHLCCETTARSAFVRGFEVFFPADATATTRADFHQATLLNLGHGFATLSLSADLQARFPSR